MQLFGTDGIRGVAGRPPLDDDSVLKIGAALARRLTDRLGRTAKIIIGRDTRRSGPGIEAAFVTGATGEGAECESAGVITTPAIAYLTRAFGFDAGVVISASHNPYEDNGIKIFAPSGKKLDDEAELAIEEFVANSTLPEHTIRPVDAPRAELFENNYLEHLRSASGLTTDIRSRIVIDCANGAAFRLAPSLFASIGAEVIAINDAPDGININSGCGSLHLEGLQTRVVEEKADLGIALDGDADRALFVDENGEIVDGDATLWIMAGYLRQSEKLANSTVVATVMSNIGLEMALAGIDTRLLRADVGDKYVLEMLIRTGSSIGGEQSGHIIFPEISLVGDGLMTALLLIRALDELKMPLSQAIGGFTKYPQILRNVKVKEKRPFETVAAIAEAARQVEDELRGCGRLLLRYSGTEDLARVMIEGLRQEEIEDQADRIAAAIRSELA